MARETREIYDRLAAQDFDRAYQKGFVRAILSALSGKRSGLLSFEKIRSTLNIQSQLDRGMQEIPIECIIGSLSRYREFDATFLPRQTLTRGRWKNIDRLHLKGEILPPVEVYALGSFYFVIDGNHRVSVAREKGQKFIDAHLIELQLPYEFSGEPNWQDLLLEQERLSFLKQTDIARLRPQADIRLTLPGQYAKLLEHIDVHRYYTGEYLAREVSYEEAVSSWYDHVYQPMLDVIHRQDIMRLFPKRTQTDLYLWIIEHLAYLKGRYAHVLSFEDAAEDFTRVPRFMGSWFRQVWERLSEIGRKKKG